MEAMSNKTSMYSFVFDNRGNSVRVGGDVDISYKDGDAIVVLKSDAGMFEGRHLTSIGALLLAIGKRCGVEMIAG